MDDTRQNEARARAIAFRTLFESEAQYVWTTLRYLGVRAADLQDLTQEVFMTAFKQLEACDPIRSVRASATRGPGRWPPAGGAWPPA